MAKRRRAATAQIIRVPSPFARQPAPVIRIQTPRAAGTTKHKRHHRRRSSGSGGALTPKAMMGAALGGAIFGFIEKTFPNLPTVPLLGRSGTVAVVAYFLGKKAGMGSIVRDVGMAAAVIAGHELGSTGKISGDIADQVHGLASQV